MKFAKYLTLTVALLLFLVCGSSAQVTNEEKEGSVLDCIYEDNTSSCMKQRLARDMDQIELEVTGQKKDPPISKVIEEAGNLMAEVMSGVEDEDTKEVEKEEQGESRGLGEKFGTHMVNAMFKAQ